MWPGEEKKWYFNIKTGKVEYGRISSLFDVMGPYNSEEEARRALEKAAQDNRKWDEENRSWNEEGESDSLSGSGSEEERAKIKQDPKGEEDTPSAIF
ncbi:MAG: SPOR domain-containing protein [Bifidobacteriaceae bacterium]|nr:SPOR domain-containing protein [Aeriscardovia sp.]MBQ1803888.1 SPOR domain-containing protein [Bifidobacteriaceae bacterium]